MDRLGLHDLFNQSGLAFIRDAWISGAFGQARPADHARLVADDWPDFEIRIGAMVERFEAVEGDDPNRRRGMEYCGSVGEVEHDSVEDWIARAEEAPEARFGAGRGPLHLDREVNGVYDAAKFHQSAVADKLDGSSAILAAFKGRSPLTTQTHRQLDSARYTCNPKMLPMEMCSWCLRIFYCGGGRSRDTSNLSRAITKAGSASMTKPQVYKLDLKALKEPDDLWGRLFLAWLKNLSEENDMSIQLLRALEHAVTQLDRAVSELLPEKPDDLRDAMKAIQDVQETWKQQSARSLDNVEKAAVIGKRIIASQKSE